MAKAAGTRRIIIPYLGSPSGSLKDAGGNGTHEEVTRNFAEQVKLDSGDGSELTPRSRASWASQVEEEHEATGWTGLPRPGKEGMEGAVPSSEKPDDAATKSKKKKNKKKSKAPSTGEDIHSPASASHKSEERFRSQSTEKSLEVAVDVITIHPEFPASSLKAEGSNLVENFDKKGQSGEGLSSPAGRIKGTNTVWALKRSDSGGRLLPGTSWQPVGAKDVSLSNDGGDSGWKLPVVKHTEVSSGNWGSPTQVHVGEESGWHVSDQERAIVADASIPHPSDGNWDQPMAKISSNWDSGWEVAGSRRGKKGEDLSSKLAGGLNASQKAKGGRGFQPNSPDYVRKGAKQRPYEWEKVSRSVRSPGQGFQEKGGRPSPRNQPGPSNFGTARQVPTQSSWGKPLYKSTNNSSNWDTAGTNSANSGSSVSSASILGNLLPQMRPASDSNPGIQSLNGTSISLDAWKGGFPAFSGNGLSVFEDYPASLYSDSQCSDDDLDSDTMSLASFESEDSHKSHATQRMSKWFRNFFQDLDILTEEQLHEHDRQWHCPACQGGVGAIDWYRGLQPLLAHAKTVRSKRVKLHKAFAEVLEEEIRIRGAAPGTHGSGKYGKWRGLGDENENKHIVWPPMVVVRNTQLEQDEDDKWIGMGNKELLDLFKKHNPVKARHAYGPQGHRGISILIFAESPTGYYSAQRLETQFIEARRGKDNWDAAGKLLFQPGGDRILYGYMATADDLETFNKHSKGKQNLKWELKSFQDVVLSPMRKLDEENNKVTILQGRFQREQETSRALKETSRALKKTMSQISKKLEMREEELKVIRDRAREQHQLQQIEMEDMEDLYKEKIEQLKKEILEKEISLQRVHEEYEQEHKEQCEKLQQQVSNIPKDKDLSDEQQLQQTLAAEEIARHSQLVEMCIKNQEQWEARKAELLKEHHQKMMEFKARQWEDLIKFELKLDQERVEVMETFKFPTKTQTLSPGSSNS